MDQAAIYAALVTGCLLLPAVAVTRGSALLVGDDGLLVRLHARWVRPQVDLVALTVWARRRSQLLTASLERLSRLLASDEAMSATRQLGNRLAYRQVVADLAAVPDLPEIDDEPRRTWLLLNDAGYDRAPIMTVPGRPDVELLDVGWSWR